MHNLHLVRINATSPKEACNDVENQIMEFGNENNWRCIGGCISEDGETYDHDDYSRWKPSDENYDSLDKLNAMLKEHIDETVNDYYGKDIVEAIDSGEKKLSELTDRMELYAVGEYIKNKKAKFQVGELEEFDVMNSEYKEYEYDELGITGMDYSEKSEGEKTYIVFIDMHS